MRFLIVDQAREPRAGLAALLRQRWPDAEINEWEPESQGSPREAIAYGEYSAVLLSARSWQDAPIAMVAEICRDPKSPPLLLLSDQGGETLAVKASARRSAATPRAARASAPSRSSWPRCEARAKTAAGRRWFRATARCG
jgi:DNA-binding LytR/AlgR family response regulator